MDAILDLVLPYASEIITAVTSFIAGAIVFAVKRTGTKLDDEAVLKIAEKTAEKLKDK